ncbi:MAG: hypothetical protein MH252_07525 [Thermosynechococcaceae cyanobacterium MS004]|nr:hypothetical protein [Thermosynechococcaceae cyanobacterium MS004]
MGCVGVGQDIWITLNYIKSDIQQGWMLASAGLWAIARMRLGAGGAAEYLELVGL